MKIYKVVVGELSTNCYIVASESRNAFVIDPGDDIDEIQGVLNKNKLHPQFIFNTHGHIDHIKANAAFKLPVYAHEDERDMISDPKKNFTTMFFGSFQGVMPSKLLKDGNRVELDELSFQVIHTPGHSPGCICLLGQGVLFSGDTLFKNGVGRTDSPGASHEAMRGSLKKLSHLPKETVVYPGHGPETTIGRELYQE